VGIKIHFSKNPIIVSPSKISLLINETINSGSGRELEGNC